MSAWQHSHSLLQRKGVPQALREHAERELTPTPIERGTEYLLRLFQDLDRSRGRDMAGPLPITYTEIKAYSDLSQTSFDPWELETLRQMDAMYIQVCTEGATKKN